MIWERQHREGQCWKVVGSWGVTHCFTNVPASSTRPLSPPRPSVVPGALVCLALGRTSLSLESMLNPSSSLRRGGGPQHSFPPPGPSGDCSQVPTLPEKAEKEIMVSGGLCLVKATTLNLGQRNRTFCWGGTKRAEPFPENGVMSSRHSESERPPHRLTGYVSHGKFRTSHP